VPRDLAPRLALRGVLGIAIIDAILFGVAGRLDWRAAWVMSGLFAVYVAAGALLVTAAFDAGRVGWSQVPVAIQAAGALGVVTAFAVIWL
jgi:hypothetical protein